MKGETQTNGVLVNSTVLCITISHDMPFILGDPRNTKETMSLAAMREVRQNSSNACRKLGSRRFLWRCGSVATRSQCQDAHCSQGHPPPKLEIPEATIVVRSMAPIPMPQIPP